MNIFIVPRIKKNKTEIYLSVDINLIKFLKDTFKDAKIDFSESITRKPDIIIFSGGNNLRSFSNKNEDVVRDKIDKKIFKYGIKNNIKMIGICGGAQFLAKKFRCKIEKINRHIGSHRIYYEKKFQKLFRKEKIVNSFHDYGIKAISKNIIPLARASDKSFEFFIHKDKNILGIMWHPERYKKFKLKDKYIFRENLWI